MKYFATQYKHNMKITYVSTLECSDIYDIIYSERIILSYNDAVDCKYEYIFSPHDPI